MNKSGTFFTFLILVIVFIMFRWLGGFDGLYGQDSYEYYRYAGSLREYFLSGNHPGDYFWPIWYPLTGAILSLIVPDVGLCLQLISVISLGVTFLYTIKIIKLIFPEQPKQTPLYYGLLLIAAPYMIRLGLSVMADMFTLATLMAGYYHLFRFIKQHKAFGFILGCLLLSISFMSRYASALLILPILLFASYRIIKYPKLLKLVPITLFAVIPIFIPHILIRGTHSANFIFHDWLVFWSPLNFFENNFTTRDGQSTYVLPNILYAFTGLFHPRYFILGIPITILAIKRFQWNTDIKIISISVGLYLLFLSGIPFQNNRFLLLALPFLMIIYYPPTVSIFKWFTLKIRIAILIMIAMVQISFFLFSFKNIYVRMLTEREIYQYVKSTEPNSIYTMDMDISLRGRGCTSPIYNLWSEYYSNPDTNGIIIFNLEVFSQQWAGMNPMKNWEHFNKNKSVKELKSFNQGWKAYGFK